MSTVGAWRFALRLSIGLRRTQRLMIARSRILLGKVVVV